MREVGIALDARARRVNWLWTGLLTLVFAGLAAAIYLPDQSDPHPSPAEHWWWFGVIGVFWLASCIYLVNRGYGSTKLSRDGMQLRSLFTHRFIAWGEITQIEKHRHWTRSGS
jgi:peptidoglycan/LPS O-acetylase OafA/YrhL